MGNVLSIIVRVDQIEWSYENKWLAPLIGILHSSFFIYLCLPLLIPNVPVEGIVIVLLGEDSIFV